MNSPSIPLSEIYALWMPLSNLPPIDAAGKLMSGLAALVKKYDVDVPSPPREKRLYDALNDLVEQVDCLDDIRYSRDLEPYKAEAVWNDVYATACRVLKEEKP